MSVPGKDERVHHCELQQDGEPVYEEHGATKLVGSTRLRVQACRIANRTGEPVQIVTFDSGGEKVKERTIHPVGG